MRRILIAFAILAGSFVTASACEIYCPENTPNFDNGNSNAIYQGDSNFQQGGNIYVGGNGYNNNGYGNNGYDDPRDAEIQQQMAALEAQRLAHQAQRACQLNQRRANRLAVSPDLIGGNCGGGQAYYPSEYNTSFNPGFNGGNGGPDAFIAGLAGGAIGGAAVKGLDNLFNGNRHSGRNHEERRYIAEDDRPLRPCTNKIRTSCSEGRR